MSAMRAKMRITSITKHPDFGQETLWFRTVGKDGPYPSDGSDEDNTFAKFTPSGTLEMAVQNPALFGKFTEGQTFYVDFTEVPPKS